MRRFLSAALALALGVLPAHAQFEGQNWLVDNGGVPMPVPDFSTCAVLPSASGPFGHIWHVNPNPLVGQTQNAMTTAGISLDPAVTPHQGDATHPWNSLQAAFGTVTGYVHPLLSTVAGSVGPIQPGDEILLASGANTDYGVITIGAVANSSWLTIAPEVGAKPILQKFLITAGAHKIALRGGVYVEMQAAGNFLVVVTGSAAAPTKDILFDGIHVLSSENTSGWNLTDWNNNLSQGLRFIGVATEDSMSCGTVINSHISVTTSAALTLEGDRIRAENNELDHFGVDGIDFSGDNIIIRRNHIHDFINLGGGAHCDGMQGLFVARLTYHDILIDSNRVNLQEDPALPFVTGIALNGAIDTTDEDWTRVAIVNNEVYWPAANANAVSGNAWHDSVIANNTVFGTIQLGAPKGELGQRPNSNIWIVNNLSYAIIANQSYHVNNNLVMGTGSQLFLGGVLHNPATDGTYDGNNVVNSAGGVAAQLGSSFDGTAFVYDAHLIPGAQAIGFGSPALPAAPALDLNGNPRGTTIDAGALEFGSLP